METNESAKSDYDNSQAKVKKEKTDIAAKQPLLTESEENKEPASKNGNKDSNKTKKTKFQKLQKCLEGHGFKLNNEINIIDAVGMLIAVTALFIVIWQSCQLQKTNKIAAESLRLADSSFVQSQRSGKEESERAERTTKAMEKNVEIAERSARISNRAYMSVESVKPVAVQMDKKFEAVIQFVNVGKTPAYQVYVAHDAKIGTGVYDHEIERIKRLKKTAYQTVGASITVTIPMDGEIIVSQKNFDKIRQGQLALYIFGKCVYTDIFRAHHTTWFCFKYTPSRNIFESYDKYNDAD